jgi:hypothetical protein
MSINLQERINVLYDFIYNNLDKNCFDVNTININNLKIDDYKITDPKICENILEQILLNSTLQYFVADDKNILFKRFNEQTNLLIKLSVDDIKNQDNDSKISYILSELVLKNKTKHILLPILNLEIDINKLKQFTDIKSIDLLNKSKKCAVKIREHFYKINTLQNYLEENINENNIKILLWQIIHTLYVIIEKYPNFCHNNLNLNNILVYKKNIYDTNIEYKYDKTVKIIDNTNLEIKITNFENSIINSESKNKDLETLVKSILDSNLKIDSETKKFLNEINKNNLNNIMNNKYFNQFTKLDENLLKGGRVIVHNFSVKNTNDSILGDQSLLNNNKEEKMIRKIKNMNGGDPVLKEVKNTPFVSNDEKTTKERKKFDNPPKREPPILLEQKIYDTHQNKNTQPSLPPATIPVYDNNGGVVAGLPVPYSNYSNPYYQQPPQKIYNVSIANPMGNYTTINRVFEDIIPGDPQLSTYNSLYERTQLIKWIRNIMINQYDGETITTDSLLSYMKLVDINPYTLEKNPYKDLPRNFLIYRSAYPIRLDEKMKLLIAPHSTGINVRLYNLTYGEDNANKINDKINKFKFNVWRELEYYNYVKNTIIQKKISQNFVTSVLYKIDSKSDYQWTELAVSQKNKKNNDTWINDLHRIPSNNKLQVVNKINNNNNKHHIKIIYIDNETYISNKFYNDLVLEANTNKFLNLEYIDITKGTSLAVSKIPAVFIEYADISNNIQQEEYDGNQDKDDFINWIDINIFNNNKLDITISTNKTLVLLTESPNNNFIKWVSPIYQSFGSRQNMISTGYHPLEVYKSIIFQIVYIFAVLQKECIDFDELSLENNFYIKDLDIDKNVQTYWIYNIDSVDYYVPNYGYLVLFDSKYSNIDRDDRKYKINSLKIFPNENDDFYKCSNTGICTNCSSTTCINCTYKSELTRKFNDFINPLTFANTIKTKSGINLDNDVIKLLKLIHGDTNKEIYKKFIKYFPEYLHNRIGTILLKSEKELVSPLCRPNYNNAKGKLLIWQERNDFYRWVLYDSAVSASRRHNVYLFDNITNKLVLQNVFSSALYGYPSDEILSPNQISENQIIDAFVFEV